MIEVDRIHHADAFGLFPLIDDESIDLIVCDGPYGVTTNKWDRIGNIQELVSRDPLNTIQKPEQLIERLVNARVVYKDSSAG